MSTPSQRQRSNSSATSNTSAVAIDDLETTDEHTLDALSESASLRGAQATPHSEMNGENSGLSQASDSSHTAGREPPSLSITSSISPTASAPQSTPVNNLPESATRATRTASYVTGSPAWYSRLVEANNGNGTTHGPQEMTAQLAPLSASLEGLSSQRDGARPGPPISYPAQITESMDMLVGETSEDEGVGLNVPMPSFIMF